MKKLGENRISAVVVTSIVAATIAIVACLTMVFVRTSHWTSQEIVNGLSATFDACESVANIAEIMGDMLGDDGEEAAEIEEINAVDFSVAEGR